ncbi:MAG: hypothetical protein WBM14_15895, partial [Terracidiphilus sp.]
LVSHLERLALYVQHRKDANSDSTESNYRQSEANPEGYPVREIAFRIALNRDVCGGEFADRYGAFIVLGFFAVGIILELVAIAFLFNKYKSRLIWVLAGISLFFWLLGGLTPMIGRLPWDWWKIPQGCQEHSEYRQTFQHDGGNVSQYPLEATVCRVGGLGAWGDSGPLSSIAGTGVAQWPGAPGLASETWETQISPSPHCAKLRLPGAH